MRLMEQANQMNVDELMEMVANRCKMPRSEIFPFTELSQFLCQLFMMQNQSDKIIADSPCRPEIEMAADRAEVDFVEINSVSPFSGDISAIINQIDNPGAIVYLANPNRVSGANYSLSEISELIKAIPDGLLIVDEYYYEHHGISAKSLTSTNDNLLVLRSFVSPLGINSSDSGFAIGSIDLIEKIGRFMADQQLSSSVKRTIFNSINNDSALTGRVRMIHDESLRLTSALTMLGIQCRLTSTDFLLMRVADPTAFGNFLNGKNISIENLDGYPGMKNYMRYQIQSELSNDHLVYSCQKMPSVCYRMSKGEKRPTKLHRNTETRSDSTASQADWSMIEESNGRLKRHTDDC